MSHVPQNSSRQRTGSRSQRSAGSASARSAGALWPGLPLWAGPVIIAAALVTGILLSLVTGTMGAAYLWCFGLGVLAVTLLINPRGLYITVASIPILFAILTPLGAWILSSQLMGGMQRLSMTTLVTIIYPLMQLFPEFFLITVLGLVIAVVRWWLLRRQQHILESQARESRRKDAEAERRNQETTRRARERTAGAAATATSTSSTSWSSTRRSPRTPRTEEKRPERSRSSAAAASSASASASASAQRGSRSARDARQQRSPRSTAEGRPVREPRSASSRSSARQVTVEELLRRSGRARIIGNANEDIYTRRLPEETASAAEQKEHRGRRRADARPRPSEEPQKRDRYLAYGERYHGFRDRDDRHYQRDDWDRARERRHRSRRDLRDQGEDRR
ncbi:hypothetical protein L1O03_06650 [Corynebacterium uropygiale]|uniref:DUF6542 domain-containing protein n=1 Tax=Corynebacterium uropygiale TaxID=1775911 RepID=A0A9X1U0U0_9CORY|nr:DUF6542 domain-containing protein [Corynebacterium uropygiale]MCF4006858.1 hypothetical protein [Corynebacterium uropygiale]